MVEQAYGHLAIGVQDVQVKAHAVTNDESHTVWEGLHSHHANWRGQESLLSAACPVIRWLVGCFTIITS